jgi:hypothetical protein
MEEVYGAGGEDTALDENTEGAQSAHGGHMEGINVK